MQTLKDYPQIGLNADWAVCAYLIARRPNFQLLILDQEDGTFTVFWWAEIISSFADSAEGFEARAFHLADLPSEEAAIDYAIQIKGTSLP
jgi:hypothetical protein